MTKLICDDISWLLVNEVSQKMISRSDNLSSLIMVSALPTFYYFRHAFRAYVSFYIGLVIYAAYNSENKALG